MLGAGVFAAFAPAAKAAGAGLLIDRWIGAGHWGFFRGFFLGLAAGVVTVVRASKSIK